MITLFLLSLVIKLTGVIMIYTFRVTWEIIAFIICFIWFFVVGFISAAKTEYNKLKTV